MIEDKDNNSTINELRKIKFDVAIAEMSRINQYAFALFHSMSIPKTIVIKKFSIPPIDLFGLTNDRGENLYDKLANAEIPIPRKNFLNFKKYSKIIFK